MLRAARAARRARTRPRLWLTRCRARRAAQEEADQILFLGLRDVLGADLPAEVAAPRDVDCDVFVRCCARCLRAVSPEDAAAVPDRLPADMSGRFRVGTDLASRMQRLGYRGDLGFHQLLYPNEADVRRILVFLLDRVPKAAGAAAQAEGAAASAGARVHAALRGWVSKGGRAGDGGAAAPPPPPPPVAPFWTVTLATDDARALVTAQAQPAARLAPSLLELAACSALAAAHGADSELARLAAGAGASPQAISAQAAAVRAAVAAGLSPKAGAQRSAAAAAAAAAPAADDADAQRRAPPPPDAAPAGGAGDAGAALTPEARLARHEAELASLQAELQRAVGSIAAAEARAAAAEEQQAALRAEAAAAACATPRLEQEYLLRKQTAALLVVRGCRGSAAAHALAPLSLTHTCVRAGRACAGGQ